MTKEEAIEKCKKIINTNNNVIKEARRVRDINTMQLVASLDDESIAIETVLNNLQGKERILNRVIDKLKGIKQDDENWNCLCGQLAVWTFTQELLHIIGGSE